jgi:hypothetical protein
MSPRRYFLPLSPSLAHSPAKKKAFPLGKAHIKCPLKLHQDALVSRDVSRPADRESSL